MEMLSNLLNDLLVNWQFISAERFVNGALALILAMVIGFITGPRGNSAVPAFWRIINGTFGVLSEKLDNIHRGASDLLFRGFLVSVLVIVFCGSIGIWLEEVIETLPQSRLIEIIIILLSLSAGAVLHHGMRLHQVLKGAKMSDGTYLTLARTSRFDLSNRDDATLTRIAAEITIRLFDKAICAPLIWYALGGLPLLFIYSALAALVWRVGYDGAYEGVGRMFLALEKLMGFIPSVMAGSMLAVTTLVVPKSNARGAIAPLVKPDYPYESGGVPIAVMAHSLNLSLGGPVTHLNGRNIKRKWTEQAGASAQLQADHLKSVLYMAFIAQIYMVAAMLGTSMWAGIYF